MKYLGIDYGLKRVGIAISDNDGRIAFPKVVLPNNKNLIPSISKICDEENVKSVVLGESKNLDGKDNPLQDKIMEFGHALQKILNLSVFYEPEFLTSAEATRLQGENKMSDASAAAIILRSFLEKKQNDNNR